MDKLRTRLERLLQQELPGASLEWEAGDRLTGLVIWDGFAGTPQTERQRRVWDAIRTGLSADDQVRILALLTVTPAEHTMMTADLV